MDGSKLLSDVWKFNLISNQWTKCPFELKMGTFYHTSVITPVNQFLPKLFFVNLQDGCLFTFGGCIDKCLYPSNRLQRSWLTTPKLKYLAMFNYLNRKPELKDSENDEAKYTETIKFMRKACTK